MSIDLGPALADLLRQLGAPFDDSRLLVEAHPDREHEVRQALAEQPDHVRNLVDLRFPADYPADSVGVRPVHQPQWHVVPRTITIPETPEPSEVAPGWLLTAIVAATGTHDCPVCNAGRPLPDGVTCPLCAGWTTI